MPRNGFEGSAARKLPADEQPTELVEAPTERIERNSDIRQKGKVIEFPKKAAEAGRRMAGAVEQGKGDVVAFRTRGAEAVQDLRAAGLEPTAAEAAALQKADKQAIAAYQELLKKAQEAEIKLNAAREAYKRTNAVAALFNKDRRSGRRKAAENVEKAQAEFTAAVEESEQARELLDARTELFGAEKAVRENHAPLKLLQKKFNRWRANGAWPDKYQLLVEDIEAQESVEAQVSETEARIIADAADAHFRTELLKTDARAAELAAEDSRAFAMARELSEARVTDILGIETKGVLTTWLSKIMTVGGVTRMALLGAVTGGTEQVGIRSMFGAMQFDRSMSKQSAAQLEAVKKQVADLSDPKVKAAELRKIDGMSKEEAQEEAMKLIGLENTSDEDLVELAQALQDWAVMNRIAVSTISEFMDIQAERMRRAAERGETLQPLEAPNVRALSGELSEVEAGMFPALVASGVYGATMESLSDTEWWGAMKEWADGQYTLVSDFWSKWADENPNTVAVLRAPMDMLFGSAAHASETPIPVETVPPFEGATSIDEAMDYATNSNASPTERAKALRAALAIEQNGSQGGVIEMTYGGKEYTVFSRDGGKRLDIKVFDPRTNETIPATRLTVNSIDRLLSAPEDVTGLDSLWSKKPDVGLQIAMDRIMHGENPDEAIDAIRTAMRRTTEDGPKRFEFQVGGSTVRIVGFNDGSLKVFVPGVTEGFEQLDSTHGLDKIRELSDLYASIREQEARDNYRTPLDNVTGLWDDKWRSMADKYDRDQGLPPGWLGRGIKTVDEFINQHLSMGSIKDNQMDVRAFREEQLAELDKVHELSAKMAAAHEKVWENPPALDEAAQREAYIQFDLAGNGVDVAMEGDTPRARVQFDVKEKEIIDAEGDPIVRVKIDIQVADADKPVLQRQGINRLLRSDYKYQIKEKWEAEGTRVGDPRIQESIREIEERAYELNLMLQARDHMRDNGLANTEEYAALRAEMEKMVRPLRQYYVLQDAPPQRMSVLRVLANTFQGHATQDHTTGEQYHQGRLTDHGRQSISGNPDSWDSNTTSDRSNSRQRTDGSQ